MNYEKREYARGTFLTVSMPWSRFVGGQAMCPDGKVRRLKRIAESADTFFSIPAAVDAFGKTVAGYVTFEGDGAGKYLSFRAVHYRKNFDVFDDKTPIQVGMHVIVMEDHVLAGHTGVVTHIMAGTADFQNDDSAYGIVLGIPLRLLRPSTPAERRDAI